MKILCYVTKKDEGTVFFEVDYTLEPWQEGNSKGLRHAMMNDPRVKKYRDMGGWSGPFDVAIFEDLEAEYLTLEVDLQSDNWLESVLAEKKAAFKRLSKAREMYQKGVVNV
tara:strand:+ start:417 stop:749 length:333 start_codon:yes stop_codon:yes gene_type:complete